MRRRKNAGKSPFMRLETDRQAATSGVGPGAKEIRRREAAGYRPMTTKSGCGPKYEEYVEPLRKDGNSRQGFFKRRRESYLDRHPFAEDWQNRFFSATTAAGWRAARPLMALYCKGRALDAGSGRRGWSRIILETAESRDSIDIAPRGGDQPTWVSDISGMPEVPANTYDTVVCHQVLEHVRRPGAAVTEILRVLVPGGHAIFSVPHLSRRHELPHDYQRYTQEGLNALLVDNNFDVLELVPYGGMLSFVHHQLSSLLILPATALPVLPDLITGVNAPMSLAIPGLDRLIDPKSLAPSGIVAVAQKAPASRRPKINPSLTHTQA